MAKGGGYERELCVKFSLWWTGGADEDIFWRTSGSGARATVRRKKGKRTTGHSGDICATDPVGQPFIDYFTIESKRGYNRAIIHDILDRSKTAKVQKYEEWIEQAVTSHTNAGSFAWMLIHKRDYREPLLFMPGYAAKEFPLPTIIKVKCQGKSVAGYLFEEWLKNVSPELIKELSKEWKNGHSGTVH